MKEQNNVTPWYILNKEEKPKILFACTIDNIYKYILFSKNLILGSNHLTPREGECDDLFLFD